MADQACFRSQQQTLVVQHYSTLMLALCILTLLSSLVTSIGNFLVIYLLWKASSIPAKLKKLFLGLAFSDLAVGLFAQPMHGIIIAVMLKKAVHPGYNSDFLCPTIFISYISGYFLAVVTFLNITAIAVDRLLAVFLHLRYEEFVTSKRIVITLVSLWLASGVTTSLYMSFPSYGNVVTVVLECVGLILTAVAYIRIYQVVRYHQLQIQEQYNDARERLRERKSAINALYVFVIFVACYLPNLCVAMLLIADQSKTSFRAAYNVTAFFVLFNSSVNPIVYCWRYREIREVMKHTIRRILRSNPTRHRISRSPNH
ncbi:melanocyte-stimulating hormone receptor-like [Montipora capricornis]|uniref:melanocyte-stimulating hormone receptor-like n=1 Tax=Montipora capricornis TaxID=246305 RepID=UPI0035F14282